MSKNTTNTKGEGANTPNPQTATPAILPIVKVTSQEPTREETPEELKARIKKLEAQLSQGPESFDDKIKYYQRKQELIEQLQQFDTTHDIIKQHLQAVNKEHNEDIFTSDNYSIVITGKKQGGYSEAEILKFKNPSVISDLLSFILAKVEAKQNSLQFEISE